jgi:hypothetical protein
VIPKYANLKFTNTSPAAQVTGNKAQILRVKNEIKFLFKRKERLNRELYTVHMKAAANEWESMWATIQDSIHESMNHEMEKKYQPLDKAVLVLISAGTR